MRITLLGTGTSYPDPERVQSGILIDLDQTLMLLDIGSGVLHRLLQTGSDVKSIDTVFISHTHVDHCSDFMTLCQTLWMAGFDRSLRLLGSPAVAEWFTLQNEKAYPYLRNKVSVEVTSLGNQDSLQLGETMVRCCRTVHGTMDSRAIRIERGRRSLVYSADTAPSEDVIELSKGADLLIHECFWPNEKHPEGVHTGPSELAAIVQAAQPKQLILSHLSPDVVSNESRVVSLIQKETNVDVLMGRDLMKIRI